MSAALALQKAIRTRLTTFPAVVALVEPVNVIDRHGAPATFPSIVLGEDQEVDAEITFDRRHVRVFATLHVWDRAATSVTVKAIAGAIREAVRGAVELELDGARLLDLKAAGARYLRDPDGKTAHAVVTLEALVEEGRP